MIKESSCFIRVILFFTAFFLMDMAYIPKNILATAPVTWELSGSIRAHDPTIIKEKHTGTWWIFTTGQGIGVKYSSDGNRWIEGRRIFPAALSWWRSYSPGMEENMVWAPDISYYKGRYWMYYSVSTFGINNSAIGLVSCTSITAGDWRDDGMIISSRQGVNTYNAIDPQLTFDAAGAPWLSYGSWFDGIHVVQLDDVTMKPKGMSQIIAQGNNGIEGPNIIYNNGYYYLFASYGRCCDGVNSTYRIGYGRSKSIKGPYLNKEGLDLLKNPGTLLAQSGTRWKGPGGQTVYKNEGSWLIAYHAYDADHNGDPTLQISDLSWDSAGWPVNLIIK